MNTKQVAELVLQSLEHERGGVQVYETALKCAVNTDLQQEWTEYFKQTKEHVKSLESVCRALGLAPKANTPGCEIVHHLGGALVQTMERALAAGDRTAAQIVACECVVIAETKDHADWELLGRCAEHLDGPGAQALKAACEAIGDQEDEHLYHTKGWCRELWIQSLGMNAILPPPEERQKVTTAIGAARAEQAAEKARSVS